MLGLPAWQIDTMFPPVTGGGLLGGVNPETQGAIDEYAAMDGLLAPPAPDRFWQGGKKFGVKDGLAGLLAAAGDALMAQAGMGGGAVQGLLGGRSEALQAFEKQAEQERQLRKLIALGAANGIPENVVRAQAAGLKLPEPEKPPAIGQTLDYYMQNIKGNPEREAAFKEVQSILNPKWITGADQLPYQVNGGGDIPSAPVGELTPLGGGTGNGAGGFRFR